MDILKKKRLAFLITTLSFLVATLTCLIVDYAISKEFTWSLVAIGGMGVCLVTLVPLLLFKKEYLIISLTLLALASVPYLYLIGWFVDLSWMFEFSIPLVIASYIYGLIIIILYKHLKISKFIATIITIILIIPFEILVQWLIAKEFVNSFPVLNIISTIISVLIVVIIMLIKKTIKK